MVTILPRKHGFGQHHSSSPRQTPYLQGIIDEPISLARSATSVAMVRSDVLAYRNSSTRPTDRNYRIAVALANIAFRLPEPVKMIHLNDVFSIKSNIWSSSPGLPWTDYGYKTKRDVARDPDAVRSVRKFWHNVKYGRPLCAPDCCAYVKASLCKADEQKTRAIWGMPATLIFGEAVFSVPLIAAYQRKQHPIAYGYETSLGGARRVYKEISGYRYKTALDFSSFDKTVPKWIIEDAFDILRANIDWVNYEDHGVADASRMLTMFEYIVDYFINTPIRLCTGERFRKHAGVASGSNFTQLIDSIVNYILIVWSHLDQFSTPPEYIRVFGDDSLFGSEKKYDIDRAYEFFQKIGMRLNIPKSISTRFASELTFLGFNINTGIPTKSTESWFAALLCPERDDRSWDEVATRALGLLHACCGFDYKFDAQCRAIIAVRPFNLTMSRSFSRYLAMLGIVLNSHRPPSHFDFVLRLRLF